jgi:hypothetical protein
MAEKNYEIGLQEVSRDNVTRFLTSVFFIQQILLVPIGMPGDNFDFFQIFAEIFDSSGASPMLTTPA